MSFARNKSFFYGMALGLLCVYYGLYLEHFKLKDIINLPAALIVFGGAFGASLIEVDFYKFLQRRGSFKHLVFSNTESAYYNETVDRLIYWGKVSRATGLLSLEKFVKDIEHPLLQECLKMMIDGYAKEDIIRCIDDYHHQEKAYIQETESFFFSMAGYLPTFGIFGAVIGLIQVLKNMAEPSLLGEGIAVAFIATAYGVFTANMICLPLSMRSRHQLETLRKEMSLIERGLVMIIDGVNPKIIEHTLKRAQNDL